MAMSTGRGRIDGSVGSLSGALARGGCGLAVPAELNTAGVRARDRREAAAASYSDLFQNSDSDQCGRRKRAGPLVGLEGRREEGLCFGPVVSNVLLGLMKVRGLQLNCTFFFFLKKTGKSKTLS